MIGISTQTITALLLAFGIGMLATALALRPTTTIIIQNQPQAQPGNLGLLLALGALIPIWLALAAMIR